jgi:hypothetical protein
LFLLHPENSHFQRFLSESGHCGAAFLTDIALFNDAASPTTSPDARERRGKLHASFWRRSCPPTQLGMRILPLTECGRLLLARKEASQIIRFSRRIGRSLSTFNCWIELIKESSVRKLPAVGQDACK